MGKTTIEIKPKVESTTNTTNTTVATTTMTVAAPEVPKKRGRPPKSAVSSSATAPATTYVSTVPQVTSTVPVVPSNDGGVKKTYSLLSATVTTTTSTGSQFLLPAKNTVVQLKITKEEIDHYENNRDWRNMTLLDTTVAASAKEPAAYNSAVIYESANPAPPVSETVEKVPESKGLTGMYKPINKLKLTKAVDGQAQTQTPVQIQAPVQAQLKAGDETFQTEQRRNLIINSGVQRRITKLMSAFTGAEWPNYSPYDCWYCCSPFSTAPVGIPEKLINDGTDKWTFQLYGNFCSYNCAARYLNPHGDNPDDYASVESNFDLIRGDEKSEQMQLLELLCHIETEKDIVDKIKLAPPRLALKRFGGKLTIEEFRQNFNQHLEYHVFKSPLVPISYELEEASGGIKQDTKKGTIPIDYSRVERAYRELSKQREQLKNKSVICKMLQKVNNTAS